MTREIGQESATSSPSAMGVRPTQPHEGKLRTGLDWRSLQGAFPEAQGYAEIDDVRRITGGEATNSSIVLSRLGARVKLDGNWLGADENGRHTKALLADYGIDTSRMQLREGYAGVQEVVFSAEDTRTIFGTYGRLLQQRHWSTPRESDITESKVVCLDPFFAEPASFAAEVASAANIPVVTVDCGYDSPLLNHISAVVIAESYIKENYSDCDLIDLFRRYQAATTGLVIFTFGSAPIWYARNGEDKRLQPTYDIKPVDTTGGGDAFRAGITYGVLQGWQDKKMIQFAAAVAAMVCTRFPGVMDAPTLAEVHEFMAENSTAI